MNCRQASTLYRCLTIGRPMAGLPIAVKLVLDTNVVLDWLVFEDPALSPLGSAAQARSIQLITHEHAIQELTRVLGYPRLRLSDARQQEVLKRYRASCGWPDRAAGGPVGKSPLPPGFPHCRDPDDDPFLALAYHAQADALVSKDRQVLSLRRRLRRFGPTVVNVKQMVEMIVPCPKTQEYSS